MQWSNDTNSNSFALWRTRLHSLAMPRLANTPLANPLQHTINQKQTFIKNFRDDLGNRRPTDAPMLAHMLQVPYAVPPTTRSVVGASASNPAIASMQRTDELQLWQALHTNTDPLTLIAPAAISPTPLFPHLHHLAIELWTESELSGLHALSHFVAQSPSEQLRARMHSAALWLLDNIQPDNATQRPWAIHVFLHMAHNPSLPESTRANAHMYAQTLLHNTMIPMGPQVPDIFSACALLDSARLLT